MASPFVKRKPDVKKSALAVIVLKLAKQRKMIKRQPDDRD